MLKKSSYKKSLWKNGLGNTNQIDIFPPDATLAKEDFLWRLSSAHIRGKNNFSQFKNFDRILIVWAGDGLMLNHQALLPDSPLEFAGEAVIECELITNEVVDLGIIFKRDSVAANFELLDLNSDSRKVSLNTGHYYLFLAKGSHFLLDGLSIRNGDTAMIELEKETEFSLSCNEDCLIYKFSLSIIL